MSFQTRILSLFLPVILISISAAIWLFDREASRQMLFQYHAKALSIAASAAAVIDGNIHATLRSSAEEKSPGYLELRKRLSILRAANRREDTWVDNLFTVFEAPGSPGVHLIAVDPEEQLELAAHIGEPLRLRGGVSPDWQVPWVSEEFIEDQFGQWLVATAPIHDDAGRVTGNVVASISAKRIENRSALIRSAALNGLGIGLVLALVASVVVSRAVTRPLKDIHAALAKIGAGDLSISLPALRKDEFGAVEGIVNQMVKGLRERETVKSAFARYVSHQVMDAVIKSGVAPVVQGERRKVTILFSDIRGFTSLSEKLPPEAVVALLNEYFEKMVEIIFRHGGTLDKYMGDGVMVIFGAPAEDVHQEEHAVRAAVEMQKEARALSETWEKNHGVQVKIGIGINTGNAIVGNIGSSQRFEYTAIGDTVNLASRLESATKEHKVGILLSEYTYQGIRGTISTTRVGAIPVRGKEDPVLVYSLE